MMYGRENEEKRERKEVDRGGVTLYTISNDFYTT